MPTIELPEFGSAQTNENEPTTALKQSGWADGDQVPASVLNWQARATYDSLRALLGLHLAALVDKLDTGPQVNPGNDYDIQAIEIDAGGSVLIASLDTVSNGLAIYRSTDNGASYSSVFADGAWDQVIDALPVSDGVYALCATSGTVQGYHYAAFPFASWSFVAHTWGGKVVDYMLADIGDGHGPSLLVLTDAGSIWVADATAAPTTSGDWTEYDISSVIAAPSGFALDRVNGRLVVAGDDGTAYCDIADGVAAGDFSTPDAHGGTPIVAVAHNGARFVIVQDATEDMWWSDDAVTWVDILNDTGLINFSNQVLLGDTNTGFFFLFDGETGSASGRVAVSRDGIFWITATPTNKNIYVEGTKGTAPKLHPIVHRFIAPSYNAGGTVRRFPVQTL